MSRRVSSTSPRRLARISVLLLALAAFGVQQWAVAAHWHGPATAGVHTAADEFLSPDAPSDGQRAPHPDCLWCQATAHASAGAPPPAWSGLPFVAFHSFIRPPAGAMAEFLPPLSWAWHSRGPPAA